MKIRILILGVLLMILSGIVAAKFLGQHGFDLENTLVPADEILPGGPPKDGIPAIDKPQFIQAAQAKTMHDDERILGVTRHGISKAYPIHILNWHEIVNDMFGIEAITITYCPLCGSGMAFKADVDGKRLKFGVSGLLYNSDVLLFDRETESLWSQILSKAISGSMKGKTLTDIAIDHTSWADWRQRHPDTLLLSEQTGFKRDYQDNPYADYDKHGETYFPVKFRAQGYHPKEQVFGIRINNKTKAYPFVELSKSTGESPREILGEIQDKIGSTRLVIRFDPKHRVAQAFDTDGKQIPGTTLFWFAWFAFHPETEIYKAKK